MSHIDITAFSLDDFDAWHRLWRGYQDFYAVDIPDVVTETTWHRLLDDSEPMHGVFARSGGIALGIVHFIEHRSCWTSGNYIYLQDLFVAPERRGQGIGRRLIEHVYQVAAQRDCSRVYWLTHESNTDARALYDQIADRSGFIQYRKNL